MKIYSIQYLRGVAAGLVLIAHSLRYSTDHSTVPYTRVGSLGVALFFVVSGFIMVLICGEGTFDRVSFYKRRILRVVPLYWIATTAVALLAIIAPSAFKNTEFTLRQYVLSLLFVPHYRPNGEVVPLLKLGWTLNLEMFFYACFGVLAFLTAGRRVALLSALFVTLAVLGAVVQFDNAILHAYTLFDLVSFCLGMWVGLMTLRDVSVAHSAILRMATLVLSAAFLALGFVLFPTVPVNRFVTALQAVGSALLLVAALGFEPTLPRLRWLTLTGDASYSTYLVHMYVVGAAVAVIHRFAPGTPLIVIAAAGIIAGGSAGLLTHLLVERPILKMTARPRRRIASPKADTPVIEPPFDGLNPALMSDKPSPART